MSGITNHEFNIIIASLRHFQTLTDSADTRKYEDILDGADPTSDEIDELIEKLQTGEVDPK